MWAKGGDERGITVAVGVAELVIQVGDDKTGGRG
jgi:hypothetical protein